MNTSSLPFLLSIATGLTLLLGLTYVNNQQILRLGANEPQEWIASDAAAKVAAGMPAAEMIVGSSTIEISTDTSPYIDVYDVQGNPIAGTGLLHGKLAVVPEAVLTHEAQSGSRGFVTWQPGVNIREAIVIVPIENTTGGYVVAGRSLAYVEHEEDMLTLRTFLGWIGIMIGTFVVWIGSLFLLKHFN
jgi:hypothetical protein